MIKHNECKIQRDVAFRKQRKSSTALKLVRQVHHRNPKEREEEENDFRLTGFTGAVPRHVTVSRTELRAPITSVRVADSSVEREGVSHVLCQWHAKPSSLTPVRKTKDAGLSAKQCSGYCGSAQDEMRVHRKPMPGCSQLVCATLPS